MSDMPSASGMTSPLGSIVGVPEAGPAGVLYLSTKVREFRSARYNNIQKG